MYSKFLVHFCARRYPKDRDKAQATLLKILDTGYFKPTRWRIFEEHSFNVHLAPDVGEPTEQEEDPEMIARLERRAERRRLYGGNLEADLAKQREEWNERLRKLRVKMTCFTDLPFPALLDHVDTFGTFGIALKKGSSAASKCHPVHYVTPTSPPVVLANLTESIRGIVDQVIATFREKLDETAMLEVLDGLREVQETLEEKRWHFVQDITYLGAHEWRFVPTDAEQLLRFSANDIAFVFVDTWEAAVEWNRKLATDLKRYGDAGVMAIPVALLQEGGVTARRPEVVSDAIRSAAPPGQKADTAAGAEPVEHKTEDEKAG